MNTCANTNTWEYQVFRFDRMKNTHTARLLVIDDEASFRELVREELEERRFSVHVADGTLPLRDVLRSFNPDLILLDLYMHGNQGWNILSACKESGSALPVLIHTAYDSFSHDSRFCLADGLIVKSIHFEKLIEAIIGALGEKPQNLQEKESRFPVSSGSALRRTHHIQ